MMASAFQFKTIIHPSIYLHQATWPISQEKLDRKTDKQNSAK